MKRSLFCVTLLLLSVAAFAQVELSAGAQAGYLIDVLTDKVETDPDNWTKFTLTDHVLDFGAFVDATYVRLGAEFALSAGGNAKAVFCSGGTETEVSGDYSDAYSRNLINIVFLGKYPLAVGPVTIWPTAGGMYSILLSWDQNGDGVNDDLSTVAMNDVFLVAGCGVDFPLTESIFLTGSALFNYDLTPIPEKNYELATGETVRRWMLAVRLGAGFKF